MRNNSQLSSKDVINKSVKIITSAYLICVLAYILTVFLLRIAITIFDATVPCFVFICSGIWNMIARILLSLIYLDRLYLSFKGAAFAYPSYVLIIIGIIDIIGICAGGVWYLYNVAISAYESLTDTNCVTTFGFALYLMPGVIFDVTINIIILSMFIQRLFLLVREMSQINQFAVLQKKQSWQLELAPLSEISTPNNNNNSDNNNNNNNNIDIEYIAPKTVTTDKTDTTIAKNTKCKHGKSRSRNTSFSRERQTSLASDGKTGPLISLITKLTVLLLVSVVSSILLFTSIGIWLAGGASFIDASINVVCALYCFTFYETHYRKYCNLCDAVMFRCCILCALRFSTESRHQENDRSSPNVENV